MHSAPIHRRSGLTLLEVMVALVILGLVGTAFLETFTGAFRASARAQAWAQALVYAGEGQEATRSAGVLPAASPDVPLGGGFRRRITSLPWGPGVARITVTVTLPDGRQLGLDRLAASP
jgi:prepilin-type N-terminal cleavage/methylation domain-containing protein